MRDDYCPAIHGKGDAAEEPLEARIGVNRVPLSLNIQKDQIIAFRESFLERLQRQVLVSQPCVMQISRIG